MSAGISGSSPQQSIEAHLQKIGLIGSQEIKDFASQKLKEWRGRTDSQNEVSETISEMTVLIEKSTQTPDRALNDAVIALKQAASNYPKVQQVAGDVLGAGSSTRTLSENLSEIKPENLDKYPAFHEDWGFNIAEAVLKLESAPIGSFVITGPKDEPQIYIKEDREDVGSYPLSKNDDGKFTIFATHDDFFGRSGTDDDSFGTSGTDDDIFIRGGGGTDDDDDFDNPDTDIDSEPNEPAKILEMGVTPLSGVKPKVVSLLNFKNQLSKVVFARKDQFSNKVYLGDQWRQLKKATEALSDGSLISQQHNSDQQLKSAVDIIRIEPSTAMKVKRGNDDIFFHGNTVTVEGNQFNCHQLPTDHSRDDLWLSLWNDAEKGDGKATIIKLSTPGCRTAGDIPTLRKYWPVSENDPEIGIDFKTTCTNALNKLAEKTEKKIQPLNVKIARYSASREKNEAKLAELKKEIDGDSEKKSSLEDQISKLEAEITKTENAIKHYSSRKECAIQSSATQKAFIEQQLQAFTQDPEKGVFKGSLKTQDEITVTLASEDDVAGFPGAVLRKFTLSKSGEENRSVTQIDYPEWNDFGASSSGTLPSLRSLYKKEHGDNPTAASVHCRAGVGRTGTFIAYESITNQLEKAVKDNTIDTLKPADMIISTIMNIRKQRNWQMVQRPQQAQQLVSALETAVNHMIKEADQG